MSEIISMEPIGFIRSPYTDSAPYQPTREPSNCSLELKEEYISGLQKLDGFRYIYVLFYLNRQEEYEMKVNPPWAEGLEVGLFSTRSPSRPNYMGLSVTRLLSIEKNIIYITSIDAFDGTPILDIKPYISELDSKDDANDGWLDELEHAEHFKLHLKGIPHEY